MDRPDPKSHTNSGESCYCQQGTKVRIYWGFKDVPELANLSRSQRRKVLRACFRKFAYHQWLYGVGISLIYLLGFVGDMIGLVLQDKFGFSDRFDEVCGIIGTIIGGLICMLIFYTILIERFRPYLREYLATHQISN
jgi:uncharacterized membrane protein YeaQ/YmgE (transglycosylase-associated protein family)